MQPVSQQFLDSLAKPHEVSTSVTFTPPGGSPVDLRWKSGTVKADSQSNFRRTGSMSVLGTRADYDLLSTPGGVLHIDHGIDYSNGKVETVPVFHGELFDGSQVLGDGTIAFRMVDLGRWVGRCGFLSPYMPAPGTLRSQVIRDIVTAARPGTVFSLATSDTGTVQNVAWPDDRFDAISDLTKDGRLEAFFLPDGRFTIRDQYTIDSDPVWTVRPGRRGVLKSAERKRPMDKLYNTVVVRPSATDGSQTWTQQIVQVTSPTHPRHPSKIGVVPYVFASPTARTGAAARQIAVQLLDRVLGTTETLELSMLSNPALEVGDPVRVVTPSLGQDEADVVQHFLDSFSLDLVTGGMTASTRSQVVNA